MIGLLSGLLALEAFDRAYTSWDRRKKREKIASKFDDEYGGAIKDVKSMKPEELPQNDITRLRDQLEPDINLGENIFEKMDLNIGPKPKMNKTQRNVELGLKKIDTPTSSLKTRIGKRSRGEFLEKARVPKPEGARKMNEEAADRLRIPNPGERFHLQPYGERDMLERLKRK